MARYCKNLCNLIQETSTSKYKYKTLNWCKECVAYFKKTITICPCCKNKLRTSSK